MKLNLFLSYLIISSSIIISLSQGHKKHIVMIDELKDKKKLCVKMGDEILFIIKNDISFHLERILGVNKDEPDIEILQKIEGNRYVAKIEGMIKVYYTQRTSSDHISQDNIFSMIGGVAKGFFEVITTKFYEMKIVVKEKYGMLSNLNCLF